MTIQNLDDLEHHEQLALVGLVRVLVRMDGSFSTEEVVAMNALARQVGFNLFWRLMAEAQASLPETEDVIEAARKVERRDVQEWILRALVRIANVDGLDPSEQQMLDWLRGAWQIGSPG